MTTSSTPMTAPTSEAALAALRGATFLRLTTFRRNGTPVATPVWFALDGDKIYVATTAHSGKVKRIRRNPRVLIGPATARGELVGPEFEARARILPASEATVARRALRRRNGLQAWLGALYYRLRGWQHAYLEIELV